tara:strand:- start:32 stop:427 length:396 start_codon:yes stop_codon:yes gene_type:complete
MILTALLLILYNARENISYFYTPSELMLSKTEKNTQVRIGGFVEKNSLAKLPSGYYKFRITDNEYSINVRYSGIIPDLFREGQGAVIEGYLNKDNIFNATSIFAKHDENYMPNSIRENLQNEGYWNKNYND